MFNPKISVIMPCYNDEKYVKEAIESVLNQTYLNIEFWVIDNGSTDSSGDIIDSYADRIDQVIHVKKNSAYACDGAIQNCNGEYIAVMSSNDVWELDKLLEEVKVLDEHRELGAVFTWADICDEDLNPIPGKDTFKMPNGNRFEWIKFLLYQGNHLAYFSSLVETQILRRIQTTTGFYQLGDYFLWIRLLLEKEIYVVPKILLHVRNLKKSMSAVTLATQNRTMNEQVYIWVWVLENIPDDVFVRVFQEDLIYSETRDHLSITCEKLFILEKASDMSMYLGMAFLYWYYRYFGECKELLEEKYDTGFYTMIDTLGKKGMLYSIKELEAKQKNDMDELARQINELKTEILFSRKENGKKQSSEIADAAMAISEGFQNLYETVEKHPEIIDKDIFTQSIHDFMESFDVILDALDGTGIQVIDRTIWEKYKGEITSKVTRNQLEEFRTYIQDMCEKVV